MNMKNNKRSQETQQKIEDAFVALLQEKSLHEVEASEICELAQINRSTFYAHYDSVSALANAFSEKTEEFVLAQPHTANDYTWLFDCIKNHRQRFSAYFKLGIREVQTIKLYFSGVPFTALQSCGLKMAVSSLRKKWGIFLCAK